MKNLFILLSLIGISHFANALVIQQITITSVNPSDINIHTRIADGYYFEYYNHNYEINGNTITLNICYSPYLIQAGTVKENDFVIPNINIDPNNFILVVNVYKRRYEGASWVCDSPIDSDTATLSFSTPLNSAVTLSSNGFNENKSNLMLYPNPTKGIVNICTENEIKTLEVYDQLGRNVKMFNLLPNNVVNLSKLEDGVYFIKLFRDKGAVIKKIILKK